MLWAIPDNEFVCLITLLFGLYWLPLTLYRFPPMYSTWSFCSCCSWFSSPLLAPAWLSMPSSSNSLPSRAGRRCQRRCVNMCRILSSAAASMPPAPPPPSPLPIPTSQAVNWWTKSVVSTLRIRCATADHVAPCWRTKSTTRSSCAVVSASSSASLRWVLCWACGLWMYLNLYYLISSWHAFSSLVSGLQCAIAIKRIRVACPAPSSKLPTNCKNKKERKIPKITKTKPNSKSKPNTDTHTCLISLRVCLSQKLMSMCKFHIHTIIVGLIDQLCV